MENNLIIEFKTTDTELKQVIKSQFSKFENRLALFQDNLVKLEKILTNQLAEERGKVKYLEVHNKQLENELQEAKRRERVSLQLKEQKIMETAIQIEEESPSSSTANGQDAEDFVEYV